MLKAYWRSDTIIWTLKFGTASIKDKLNYNLASTQDLGIYLEEQFFKYWQYEKD